jgi:hypothetical protein
VVVGQDVAVCGDDDAGAGAFLYWALGTLLATARLALIEAKNELEQTLYSAKDAINRTMLPDEALVAKVAAIEYLATVDCRYYPEAEAGLIAGLRAEKNECVRIAA